MPAPHPPEFRRRAVDLARDRSVPIAQLAGELGISESCLRNWMARADIDEGRREGLTTDERAELVRLRRENRCSRWNAICCLESCSAASSHGHRHAVVRSG